MVTISGSNRNKVNYRSSSHMQYAVTNIVITMVVLIFLNIYSSSTNQTMISQNKERSMISLSQLAASEIAELEVMNPATVSAAISQLGRINYTRMIVTDHTGTAIYDSSSAANIGVYVLLPEVVEALKCNDVFSSIYHDGTIRSHCATPIVSYGTVIGCVYLMEYDVEQGQLIQSLQYNILTITLIMELGIILFSILFSTVYSTRLRRIMASMRIIREGDYSHKVKMGGQDELTVLGDEFNDLTDRLQTSEGKRRQFVSDASHELKTPLASIKLLSDSILQNDMDVGTIREFVGDIGNEADRLNRMTQKLLSLTKIESQQDGTCEIISLTPTVQRVVRMLSRIAEENSITIETQIEEECPILILEDDLYQITFNLAENGIKYNLPGGKLIIRVYRYEDNAIMEVSDTGVGIPEDAISHVFERFYRVDKARSRKTGGSGLGLAIVRNMVERNQGTIDVESVIGQGTTFRVTFPIFDTEEEDPE